MKYECLVGQSFNGVEVVADNGERLNGNYRVLVRCTDCGKEFSTWKNTVKQRRPRSCGCLPPLNRTHGATGSRLYNFRRTHFELLCDEWKSDFQKMLDAVGRSDVIVAAKQQGQPIGPDNFVVVTCGSYSSRMVTVCGVTMNLKQWAMRLGITKERARQLANEGKLEERIKTILVGRSSSIDGQAG